MSVETVRERLATMVAAVTVPVTVPVTPAITGFARSPIPIPPANIPCGFVSAGPATYRDAGGIFYTTRQYTLTMLFQFLPHDLLGVNEEYAELFFPAWLSYFASRPSLDALASVLSARIVSDTGIGGINYLGDNYIGTEFLIEVEEVQALTYTDSA
jgi:hypothetical protein